MSLFVAIQLISLLAAFVRKSSGLPLELRNGGKSSNTGPLGMDNVQCTPFTFQSTFTSQNIKYINVDDAYSNDTYISDQVLQFTTNTPKWESEHQAQDRVTFKGNYQIAGSYCQPIRGHKANASLLLAVHGVGFDSRYWTVAYDPSYSFVRHAASYGYTTVVYDYLGTGKSDSPSKGGFSVVQGFTQQAILRDLLTKVRTTKLIGGKSHPKVTLVGHSYGSILSTSIAADYPSLVDNIVLTGFSINSTAPSNFYQAAGFQQARTVVDPPQPGAKPASIYIGPSSRTGFRQQFLDPPAVSQGAERYGYQISQPTTLGIIFSAFSLIRPATNYTGPVFVIDGKEDFPFCDFDCSIFQTVTNGTIPDGVKPIFPASKSFSSAIVDNVGHGISLHPNSTVLYDEVLQSVIKNGF